MVEVRVEMLSFRHVHSIWRFEVIPGEDIVDIVDSSRSHPDFEEISGPDSSIGIFGLILTEVRRIHMVMNVPVSLIPLLIVILFEMLMSRVDREVLSYPGCQLKLLIDLIQKDIVFLGDHSVTVTAVSRVNLKT